MNLMEMCSKGIPSIETEELKRKYPAERVIENVPNDENEYPAECGPSLFWWKDFDLIRINSLQ